MGGLNHQPLFKANSVHHKNPATSHPSSFQHSPVIMVQRCNPIHRIPMHVPFHRLLPKDPFFVFFFCGMPKIPLQFWSLLVLRGKIDHMAIQSIHFMKLFHKCIKMQTFLPHVLVPTFWFENCGSQLLALKCMLRNLVQFCLPKSFTRLLQ